MQKVQDLHAEYAVKIKNSYKAVIHRERQKIVVGSPSIVNRAPVEEVVSPFEGYGKDDGPSEGSGKDKAVA